MLVAVLALLALALCALALWIKALMGLGVILAAWRAVSRMAASPIVAAGWSDENDWTLRLVDHEDIPATLASFRVLGSFVLLRLRTVERGVHVLMLAPDNSDQDIRRRLRMRLATLQADEALPRL